MVKNFPFGNYENLLYILYYEFFPKKLCTETIIIEIIKNYKCGYKSKCMYNNMMNFYESSKSNNIRDAIVLHNIKTLALFSYETRLEMVNENKINGIKEFYDKNTYLHDKMYNYKIDKIRDYEYLFRDTIFYQMTYHY